VRRFLTIALGLLATFLAGILLFNFVIMPRLVQHNVTVRVPHVVGMTRVEAQRACAQVGLQLAEEDRRHSDGVPPDRVLNQSPRAETLVKRGRTVRVLVSLGPQAVTVPDVRGQTLRQATLQLENAKLAMGDVARIHAGGSQLVRATRPHAGSATAVGDSVDVLVATGEIGESFLMPDLVGHDLADVRRLLEARGFRIGRLTARNAPEAYPGTVLQQYPLGGSLIRRGDAVDLVAATPD
jgi:serine/threonine-protein kinase